jgi:CheY-like chemotaxis protein
MAGLKECQFLVVDSNPYMRQIIETILRGFGIRSIIMTGDGDEAWLLMRQRKFDCILIDFVMSGLDVHKLTQQLRRTSGHLNQYTPIIIISANSERSRVESARDAGINEMCTKPIMPKNLFLKLVAVCDYPRSFVISESYTGPDRRRRRDPTFTGPERREQDSSGIGQSKLVSEAS